MDVDDSVVPYNFGDFYGIEQWGGYVPGMPKRIHEILGRPEAPRWYGVQYRVGKAPAKPEQVEVFEGRSGLKVFRDARIGDPIEAFRDGPCAAPDRFRVVSRVPGAAVFEVELGCPALVIFGDSYYRGWRAQVDGKRLPIQEVEGGRRAIRVGSGAHRVVFSYTPASVYTGMGLSTLGLVMAFTLRRCC